MYFDNDVMEPLLLSLAFSAPGLLVLAPLTQFTAPTLPAFTQNLVHHAQVAMNRLSTGGALCL